MKKDSLSEFFDAVRSSCTEFARSKGYTQGDADNGNVAGPVLLAMGVAQQHAVGEITVKCIEFLHHPRKVVAVKIAGWAWRLWLSCKD